MALCFFLLAGRAPKCQAQNATQPRFVAQEADNCSISFREAAPKKVGGWIEEKGKNVGVKGLAFSNQNGKIDDTVSCQRWRGAFLKLSFGTWQVFFWGADGKIYAQR